MAVPSDAKISNSFLHQISPTNSYPDEELRELMVSLGKEKGWVSTDMYKYRGFWLEPYALQGALTSHRHFQAQNSDIILCTLPKCGTTWLKALIFALTTRTQFLASQETHPLRARNPHDLIPLLEFHYARERSPDFPCSGGGGQRLLSTHLPHALLPKSAVESECKLVYLCRNQKDTAVSFWHFMNKLRGGAQQGLGDIPFPEAFDRYCSGASHYWPFWDHVLGYWKHSSENPRKVLFLKFEEIKEAPEAQLKRIAHFLGCPFSEEEEERGVVTQILRLCSFQSLSSLEVNKTGKGILGNENNVFFRKGKVGDWKNHLTDEMATRLDQIVQEKFKGIGLNL